MSKKYPPDVVEQARVIADAWAQINPELTLGDLNQPGLKAQLDSVISVEDEIMSLETRLTNLRNERKYKKQSLSNREALPFKILVFFE
jgi:hypothetical protein